MRRQCAWVSDRLAGYREGWLSNGERLRVERHLAGCERCRRELEADAGLVGLLARASSPDVPRTSWSEVREVRSARAGRSQAWRWAPLAAASLLLAAFWLGAPRDDGAPDSSVAANGGLVKEPSWDVAFLLSSSADPGGDPNRILLALPREVSP
ncbi:MAG: zf-HC2 domain-containing protein [Fimbriimonadales bacterium]|nr:zf-HC2 domain-containing protein [Fimbriimonadales bacterium]